MLSPEEFLVIAYVCLQQVGIVALILLGVYVAVRFAVKHGVISAYNKIHARDPED